VLEFLSVWAFALEIGATSQAVSPAYNTLGFSEQIAIKGMNSITANMQRQIPIEEAAVGTRPDSWESAEIHTPFTLGTGDRACLLVHGIAGSPAQMRALGEKLAAAGFKARGLLLPGHGARPEDMRGIVWQDWYERVHEEYRALKENHEEVSLIGFSIGAAISAHYAAHNEVDRLALLNAPLFPLNGRYPTGLMLRVYSVFFDKVKGKAEKLIGADGEPFSYVYEWVPTTTLHTMLELVGIVKAGVSKIRAPILAIQASGDKVSGGRSGPYVYDGVASEEKRLVMLDQSEHSIMVGVDRETVCEEIIGFLNGKTRRQGDDGV
jgi:carboxylesterase